MGEIQEKHAGDRSEPGEGKKVQMNRRKVGSDYEKRAGQFLERQGLVILCYNFRNRYGEIDLVAKDGETTVFVEVKYRKDGQKGLPHDMWDFSPVRFDLVAVCGERVDWFPNAFDYRER